MLRLHRAAFVNAVTKINRIWKTNASSNAVGATYADMTNAFMSDQGDRYLQWSWMNSRSWTVLLITGLMDLMERM